MRVNERSERPSDLLKTRLSVRNAPDGCIVHVFIIHLEAKDFYFIAEGMGHLSWNQLNLQFFFVEEKIKTRQVKVKRKKK